MSRFILIREAGATVSLLIDKLTMSVSEVPTGRGDDIVGDRSAPRGRIEGIEAAVVISDAPQVSARMYYHQTDAVGVPA